MSYAYRSAYQHIVGMRLAQTRLAREVVEPLMPRLRSIRAARIARALAGGVGIAGAVAMVLLACVDDGGGATYALLGSSAAALVTYIVVRIAVAIAGRFHRAARPPQLTGHLDTDLAQLDATDPIRSLQSMDVELGRLELWSTALPFAAISLLAPLTLHWAFAALSGSESAKSFASWIRISLVIVGHAHIALTALAVAFARKMKREPIENIAEMSINREWGKAWGITIAVACVPGIVLFLVPPLLTAVTGIVFIPFMFVLMRRRILAERSTLALAEDAPGRARVEVDDVPLLQEGSPWSELVPEEIPPEVVGSRAAI